MFGNLFFGLTALVYFALIIFNLTKVTATGERLVGWGMLAFVLIAAYIISSLLLTISLASKGAFNWISDSLLLRNSAVAVLWLGLVAGVVFCTSIKADFSSATPVTGPMGWLNLPIYYGGIWLPLLMLVPYAILLSPGWRETLSPNLYKIPLIIGCTIGLVLIAIPKIISMKQSMKAIKESDGGDWAFNTSMRNINNYQEPTIRGLLSYTHREQDERLRAAALAKIKSYENWETELISILNQKELSDIYWVYAFLDGNKIEHPDSFIQPIKNSLAVLVPEVQKSLKDPASLTLGYVNIEALCCVLDGQFKYSAALFRPDMSKLQEVLAFNPPARTSKQNKQWFDETLSSYRAAINNWLDSN